MDQKIRLESARDRLASLLPHLPGIAFEASERSQSIAIDKDEPGLFLYDEDFVAQLDDDQLLFGVAHMATRVAMFHPDRMPSGGPDDMLALAQNYVVNAILVRDGIGRPLGSIPYRSPADADRVSEELAAELKAERGDAGDYVMHLFDGGEHRVMPIEVEFVEEDGTVAERLFAAIPVDDAEIEGVTA